MKLPLHPAITLSLLIISIILIHFPSSLYAIGKEQYGNCSAPSKCGGMNLSYPFWGPNRPNYCGHPDFQLNCSGDALQIRITTLNYRVLAINYSSRTLKLARADYWKTIYPTQIVDTTINTTIFSYASDTTHLKLYYDCPVTNQFDCPVNNTDFTSFYVNASAVNSSLDMCKYNVGVPVVLSAAQTVAGKLTEAALIQAIDGGFTLRWSADDAMCENCQKSSGRCGFDTIKNSFACHCADGNSDPFKCGSPKAFWKRNWQLIIAIGTTINILLKSHYLFFFSSLLFVLNLKGILNSRHSLRAGIPGLGALVTSFVVICSLKRGHLSTESIIIRRKDAKKDQINADEIMRNYGSVAPKRYTYSDVKRLTNSFKDKIGQGGYGAVYKGKLPDGRIVAVKVLSESKGNGEDFINEVASISRTSHVNVVALLGFCYQKSKRAIIYEFVSNGSLDKFIYAKESSAAHLDNQTMFEIAIGVARGLEYLHRGCRTRILHFDIKPQNILLDEEMCPKISDFGLAKLCKTKESIVSMMGIRGTAGYIAPEVFSRNFGGVSHKSDVYSYGMLVLEMVGERKISYNGVSHSSEMYFPRGIYRKLEQGERFGTFEDTTEEEEDIVKKMVIVSLWCIQTNPLDRPSMDRVIEMLEGTLQSLQVPPKPFLGAPASLPLDSSNSSVSNHAFELEPEL
ncbi:hypothetical protein CJ030_MR6G021601 [Morella rubra]|uniref:non-specific serine/threonine protein kinase n=1 Tax=Morella rubra TaxID=262757 RepID=A0A6A1VEB6_9ROSI|nr:hypothetical protein CJ030_MR6G021601 [Morella rubra]